MAQKIEGVLTGTNNGPGYELGNGKGWCDFWEGKERTFGKGKSNATLIDWGQSQHERVFTESEVRAMVREMVDGVTAGEELTLETIAAKHGILLLPAKGSEAHSAKGSDGSNGSRG